jgi:proteasome accessory factor C
MSDNRERLRRLLLVVPYAARNPGVRVEELAERLGVSKAELLEDLEKLTLVGRPPFSPDDFIDVYVENDRVHVAFDQRFSRPPRLTAAEAAALWASAQLVRPAARTALAAAQEKLAGAVPEGSRELFSRIAGQVGSEAAPMDELLEPLARAAREGREVEFDYRAAGREKGERRTVRPYAVYLHRGNWYLTGFCLARGEERLFRVDRIRSFAATDRRFQAREESRAAERGPTGAGARVRFAAGAAPWVRERFGESARELADGGVEVELQGAGRDWIVPYVLSFGGAAEVLEPAALREAVAQAARRIAGRYAEKPQS